MAKIPRIRCPVCGHLVFLRNVMRGVRHKLQVMFHYITSLGRGKIRHMYVEEPLPDGMIDFWIRRLKEVIVYLESLKGPRVKSLTLESRQQELPKLVFPVSEKSVLQMRVSPSKSQKTPILIALEESPKISLMVKEKSSLKSSHK